jgi:EAL domain-containing protein (putative c-di-GMP-specific phosphodiesterase class I)
MNADIVKIDGSLVQELGQNESTRELVASIVRFAHSSGMKVVAEVIDSPEIATLVKQLGCDYGQGYLYSKALPESELPPCNRRSSHIDHLDN